MNATIVIFKKELKDTLRDRRTLVSMVVVPLLLFPVLIGISSRIMISQIRKAQEKTLTIGVSLQGNAAGFAAMLAQEPQIRLVENLTLDSAKTRIADDSLDAFFVIGKNFDREIEGLGRGEVTMYFKSTDRQSIEQQRAKALLAAYEAQVRSARLQRLHVSEAAVNPIDVREVNLASAKEKLAQMIGGFLPYLFIIFCFLGSMYPAIDLAAGEKERGTLETLLTSPVSRLEILLGKCGVVIVTGISTAVVALVGLYIGVIQVKEIPPELLKTVLDILQPRSIVLLLSLLFPLTVFFAGVLLSLSIFARSYKEAQSVLSPAMIVVIVPAFIGLMPGVSLDWTTALVPILNVSLATKAIIADTATAPLLAEVYASSVIIAAISLYVCAQVFDKESMVFRGA
jgi:sodium transport system permease protein